MKKQIILGSLALALISGGAEAKQNIVVRDYKSGAQTIFLNEAQFIEVTPQGERLYCEDDIKGKSHCLKESALRHEKENESAAIEYDVCVHSQLTGYKGSWAKSVFKARGKCEKLLPPVVECGGDADCCDKNPVRCMISDEEADIMEGSQAYLCDDGTEDDDGECGIMDRHSEFLV